MLLANLCVAGMTCTIRHREAKVARLRAAAATTGVEPLTAPPARPGV